MLSVAMTDELVLRYNSMPWDLRDIFVQVREEERFAVALPSTPI